VARESTTNTSGHEDNLDAMAISYFSQHMVNRAKNKLILNAFLGEPESQPKLSRYKMLKQEVSYQIRNLRQKLGFWIAGYDPSDRYNED
jgi:hypothetical protein